MVVSANGFPIYQNVNIQKVMNPSDKQDEFRAHIIKLETLKVGMTRSDIEKILLPTGGLSTDLSKQNYRDLENRHIRMDVEYELSNKTGRTSAGDKVVKISKPYLDSSYPLGS